jgi:hypothetical protein
MSGRRTDGGKSRSCTATRMDRGRRGNVGRMRGGDVTGVRRGVKSRARRSVRNRTRSAKMRRGARSAEVRRAATRMPAAWVSTAWVSAPSRVSATAGMSCGRRLCQSSPGPCAKRQSNRANARRNFPTGFRSKSFLGKVSHYNPLIALRPSDVISAAMINATEFQEFQHHYAMERYSMAPLNWPHAKSAPRFVPSMELFGNSIVRRQRIWLPPAFGYVPEFSRHKGRWTCVRWQCA